MGEKVHMEEDAQAGISLDEPKSDVGNATDPGDADPLKSMLEGFWYTFNDYEGEFRGKARELLKDGNPVYEQVKALHEKIQSESPPSEEEVEKVLEGIDLTSVGAGLGEGRILPANDIVEELALIPTIPHEELAALEKAWRSGEKD